MESQASTVQKSIESRQNHLTSDVSVAPFESAAPAARRGMGQSAVALGLAAAFLGGVSLFAGMRIARASGQVADVAHILPGVRIAGIEVGGMTRETAREELRQWAQKLLRQRVSFYAPVTARAWNLTLADTGGRFDIDAALDQAFAVGRSDSLWDHLVRGGKDREANITVPFHLSESKLEKQLQRIGKAIAVAPKNARVKITDTGQIMVAAPEVKGISLDREATRAALLKDGVDSLRDGQETDLVVREVIPTVTAADVRRMSHRLGTYRTSYSSSSSNRRYNVERATAAINGTLLGPGELFSYNQVVGPRDRSLGWKDAPTIQDGQLVPGPGGGVCQVSTTLYNAVRLAKMKVVARTGHSKPVHYVPAGMDATVAYDYIDFKFRNSTASPVLVVGETRGGQLIFSLFSEAPEARKARLAKESRAAPLREQAPPSGRATVTPVSMIAPQAGNE